MNSASFHLSYFHLIHFCFVTSYSSVLLFAVHSDAFIIMDQSQQLFSVLIHPFNSMPSPATPQQFVMQSKNFSHLCFPCQMKKIFHFRDRWRGSWALRILHRFLICSIHQGKQVGLISWLSYSNLLAIFERPKYPFLKTNLLLTPILAQIRQTERQECCFMLAKYTLEEHQFMAGTDFQVWDDPMIQHLSF